MDLQDQSQLEPYIDSHPGSTLIPMLAERNLQEDQIDESIVLCQKTITENPKSPYGYYVLALAEIKTGEISDAVEHLKQTIALDNGFLDAYQLLVETGKDQLNAGALKACYQKITELNPFDENARTEADRISAEADWDALKSIHLPEVKTGAAWTRRETEVPEVSAEAAPAPKEEPVTPEAPVEPEQTEVKETIAGPETDQGKSKLGEEEAHLGPIASEEEILEPQAELSPAPDQTEGQKRNPQEEPELKPAVPDLTAPEPKPVADIEKSAEPEEPVSPETIPETSTEPKQTAAPGESGSALSDMFAKLRNKPLEEVQKEDWSLPVVEAPAKEEKTKDLVKKPNVKFTVPLRDKVDSKKIMESIHKEISQESKSADRQTEEKQSRTAAEPGEKPEPETTEESSASSMKAASDSGTTSAGKIELKIPVPTFTLVEVFKKQKLYDEALQLLDVLAKKTKDQDKIDSERKELLRLKMEAGEA